MSIVIGFAAKLVGERFAPIFVFAVALLAALGAIWWYGHTRYQAGVEDNDAKWITAGERLKQQVAEAAEAADDAAGRRESAYLERLANEKELLDEAEATGSSTFDVLFGSGRVPDNPGRDAD